MLCPNCRGAMTPMTLDTHYGRTIEIDLCQTCQVFWFDGVESLELEPASVLELFQMVRKARSSAPPQLSRTAFCPRCHDLLLETHDQQRQSKFEYRRCPEGHGRLITVLNFLREKDFIKRLSSAQLEELRRALKTINCSNCGAPVDLATASECAHCGSPLTILDLPQPEQ